MLPRRRLAVVAVLTLLSLPAVRAQEPYFSQYVEGSGSNQALEIYNPNPAAIDLAAGGYAVDIYFDGSASPGVTITLAGLVGSGATWVLVNPFASSGIRWMENTTSYTTWFDGDDAVVLRRGATVLDVIGQVGVDPGSEWGTDATSTRDNTLRRKSDVCGGDTDPTDAFAPDLAWNGYATDNFNGLGYFSCGSEPSPRVIRNLLQHPGWWPAIADGGPLLTCSTSDWSHTVLTSDGSPSEPCQRFVLHVGSGGCQAGGVWQSTFAYLPSDVALQAPWAFGYRAVASVPSIPNCTVSGGIVGEFTTVANDDSVPSPSAMVPALIATVAGVAGDWGWYEWYDVNEPASYGYFRLTVFMGADCFFAANGGDAVALLDSIYFGAIPVLAPQTLIVDASGNSVLEAGEAAAVTPAWLNQATAAPVDGAMTELDGPIATTYTILDGIADYGTIDYNTTGSCSTLPDCYQVSIAPPASRPLHWDAQFDEGLSLGGLSHTWKLHVGESFTDVPSSAPAYRPIETALHEGVTGGCGGRSYCPWDPLQRSQLAVMLLRAVESPTYFPTACTGDTRTFPVDVPLAHPYCAWIEELARRGIAGGCAAEAYCPDAAVTREQLAAHLVRARGLATTPCSEAPFDDVLPANPYCPYIAVMQAESLTDGCNGAGNLYCPTAPVTRDRLAALLARAFAGLELYAP